jgi:hypothetical protein
MWDKVINTLLLHGNKVICATSRRDTFENRDDIERELPIPIVFCSYCPKAEMVRRAGFVVDIWIDDNPHSIDPDGKYTPEETKRRFAEWRDKVEQ